MKKGGKHNTKFIPLNAADIEKEKILLPGRRECNCEASKHDLINNCLECGRIVCKQEGSGPCFTCGNLVCTPKEQEAIIRQSKTGMKLYHKLVNLQCDSRQQKENYISNDDKLKSALEHKDKLLEYDRTIEKRTKVIDDENDYFQENSNWLNEKERKVLNKKKEELYDKMHNRQKQKFTFDFAGRQVVEEKIDFHIDVEELLKPDTSIFECQDASTFNIPADLQLVYKDDNESYDYIPAAPKEEDKRFNIRIQDKGLQEIHEGRVWYSSFRGRLWIHSAGKVPTKQEIEEVKNMYEHIHGDCNFPKTYPHGCLLGCIDLVDCLPQDEYKIQYPDGEIASPYVFICENPQELGIKFPMKGKHKICKFFKSL
ncbi:activating signal cointegrator 1 [Caerostris extrusa]|uniref:Activating signal cointegrator 1 n=1 Tax=Caerostris extrusa TaxID=172846 RepID=A0AAV4YD22_CAEEX|nr:activating signal cointegrator 1 [Caerostris extrusa]